jgi:hypothetical protein
MPSASYVRKRRARGPARFKWKKVLTRGYRRPFTQMPGSSAATNHDPQPDRLRRVTLITRWVDRGAPSAQS